MRVISALAMVSSLTAVALAGPAGAHQHQQAPNTPEARLAIERYGKCTAELVPGEARRLLTMDFTSDRYRTGLRLLATETERKCAYDAIGRAKMRSSDLLFSGAIAEALLEGAGTPLNARLARGVNAEVKSYSPTDAVAQCLARSLPDQVAVLFATAPASEAEAAAATPMIQAVPACARSAGIAAKVELSVPALRAMVATAAYRLVVNSGDSNA